jgi:hypothetical protein
MAVQPIALSLFIDICGYYRSQDGNCRWRAQERRPCRPDACPVGWALSPDLVQDQTFMLESGLDPTLLEEEPWMVPYDHFQARREIAAVRPVWAGLEEE